MTAGYDVITLGETMLRLTPPGQQFLEQSQTINVYVGGSESNVAAGLARLGYRVAWVSRLTDNPAGQTIARAIQSQGVDTSHIVWTDQDRVGLYYVETGPPPRGTRVTYDRAGSAMSRMQPDDLPVDLFSADRPGWLHLSGITVAIGDRAAQTALEAVKRAKEAGWQVSFDVNYREKLWSPAACVSGCDAILQQSDLIFIALRDAITLFETPQTPDEAIQAIQARFPAALPVITLGDAGAISLSDDKPVRQPAILAQGSGRIGGGDSFAAGFLAAYLRTQAVSDALAFGVACAAHKYTTPGDMPRFDPAAIRAILTRQSGSIRR